MATTSHLRLTLRATAMTLLAGILYFIFIMSAANGQSSQSISYRFALFLVESFQSLFDVDWNAAEMSRLAIDVQFFVRKGAHITEFFLMCALSFVVAWTYKYPTLRVGLIVVALCVMVAACDELHQTFVVGRDGSIADVLVDSIGISVAFGINEIVKLRWRRKGVLPKGEK